MTNTNKKIKQTISFFSVQPVIKYFYTVYNFSLYYTYIGLHNFGSGMSIFFLFEDLYVCVEKKFKR